MYTWILVFTVFLKNRNIISKIKKSKVTDYAALNKSFEFYNCSKPDELQNMIDSWVSSLTRTKYHVFSLTLI